VGTKNGKRRIPDTTRYAPQIPEKKRRNKNEKKLACPCKDRIANSYYKTSQGFVTKE
jgi:hypothetical protein